MFSTDEMIERLGSSYTNGFGPSPIPSQIDDEIHCLLSSLMTEDTRSLGGWLKSMSERHGFVFLAYAERLASRVVRDNQPSLFAEAFSALAVAMKLVYFKEAIPIVSLLFHSAQKLGVQPQQLISREISMPHWMIDELLNDFMQRSEEDRSINSMGYIEGEDAGGFRYVRTW